MFSIRPEDGLNSIFATHYTTAMSVYHAASTFLQRQEVNAHIVFSQISAQASASLSAGGGNPSGPQTPIPPEAQGGAAPQSLWIATWTRNTTGSQEPASLDLLISLTHGVVHPNPLCIVSPHPSASLGSSLLFPRLFLLVSELLARVPADRVFSVFGPTPLAQAFVRAWFKATNIAPLDEPYSSSTYRVCTPETFSAHVFDHARGVFRLATSYDLDDAVTLLAESSNQTPGQHAYTLQDARVLIAAQAVYVYRIKASPSSGSGAAALASVAVVGRSTLNVACVTELYTPPHHRNRGFATGLLRFVCHCLLVGQRKSAVVAYLPDGNPAAQKVLDRVAFVDAAVGSGRAERTWLELGFQSSELG